MKKLINWRIRYFFKGIYNIIRWAPTIYNDRDWDYFYISKLLQKKIEFQKKYLEKNSKSGNIKNDIFWMNVLLRLIEKEQSGYYEGEYLEYIKRDFEFKDIDGTDKCYLETVLKWENLDEYINKYKSVKKIILSTKKIESIEKERLAMFMAGYRQKKCRNLIFEILKTKSENWWN